MKNELEDILLKGLAKDLFIVERDFFTYKRIGHYSEIINNANESIKSFFILNQRLSFSDGILALARIYDKPNPNYQVRCVFKVLQMLETAGDKALPISESIQTIEQLRYLRMDPMLEQLIQENDHIKFTKYLAIFLKHETIQTEFKKSLNDLRTLRDKVFAHNEIIDIDHSIQWSSIDQLINFVKKVIGIVGWAFLSYAYMIGGKHDLSDQAERDSFIIDKVLREFKLLNEA